MLSDVHASFAELDKLRNEVAHRKAVFEKERESLFTKVRELQQELVELQSQKKEWMEERTVLETEVRNLLNDRQTFSFCI